MNTHKTGLYKTALTAGLIALGWLPSVLADPLKPATEAQAKAPLERMNQRLTHARAMAATYTCTLSGFGADGVPNLQAFQVTGSAERSGKIYAEMRQAGTVVAVIASDGHALALFNGRTRQSVRITPPAGSAVPWDPFDSESPTSRQLASAFSVFRPHPADLAEVQAGENIKQAFLPFFQFLQGQYVYEMEMESIQESTTGAGGSARYSLIHTTVNGKPTLHTEMIYTAAQPPIPEVKVAPMKGVTQFDFYFDEKTGLPLRLALSTAVASGTEKPVLMPVSRYDYARLRFVQTPLTPLTFNKAPPADDRVRKGTNHSQTH